MEQHAPHHALLYVTSDRRAQSKFVWETLVPSPAHKLVEMTVFDIDTARELFSWAQTPYHEPKVAVISFHTAGIPAQNAMLKLLEEPRAGVRFVLVTSNGEQLLPTVLSRVQKVRGDPTLAETSSAKEFLATKPEARMALPFIVSLLKQEDEEGRKDREAVRAFILSLLGVIRGSPSARAHVEEVLQMASYAGDSSASAKGIVEYLALLLPVVRQ